MSTKNFRERSPLVIGLLSIAAIVVGTTLAFYIDRLPQIKQAYEVKAEFADAAGLNPENQVRVAGIKVGTVSSVKLEGDHVVVTMEIENSTDVPRTTFAEIKLATVLGTKFVDLEAKGGPPFLEDGDTIPIDQTAIPYEIYQASNQGTAVLEDLDGPALNDMLIELTKLTEVAKDEIGVALEGLNELGEDLSGRRVEMRSLLSGADRLTRLLADESYEIVRLIDASNEVLGSVARKREEVQSLLDSTKFMAAELTRLLRANRTNVDVILADLHDALKVLERNVKHLDLALEYAGPSSRYFGSIFQQGRWGDIFGCAIVFPSTCEDDE